MAKIRPISAESFDALCAAESYMALSAATESGIGMYNEKRLHRILKQVLCVDESCFEVKIGRCVADVFVDGVICEIQCASLTPLRSKLEYYLHNTDHSIKIVHPLTAKTLLLTLQSLCRERMHPPAGP